MSKIAFISDIHGNWPALQAVLVDIEQQQVDNIYCLGDLVGYYAQINEVIDYIRANNIQTCMGNHDSAIVNNKGIIPRSKTCTNVLTKQLSYISRENLDFLQQLPDRLIVNDENNKILCVHGGINDPIDEYISDLSDSYFDMLDKSITHVLTGHNHMAQVRDFNRIKYGNCGAVGQPRDHDPRASYIIMDEGELYVRRVNYDIDKTKEAMQQYGFEDYISNVLYKGYRIGE